MPNVPPPPLRFRDPLGTAILYCTSHTSYRTSTPARHPDNSLQLRCPLQGNRPHPHLHLFKSRRFSKIRKKKSNLFSLQFHFEFEHFPTKIIGLLRNVEIENREAERLKRKRKREKNDFLCC